MFKVTYLLTAARLCSPPTIKRLISVKSDDADDGNSMISPSFSSSTPTDTLSFFLNRRKRIVLTDRRNLAVLSDTPLTIVRNIPLSSVNRRVQGQGLPKLLSFWQPKYGKHWVRFCSSRRQHMSLLFYILLSVLMPKVRCCVCVWLFKTDNI